MNGIHGVRDTMIEKTASSALLELYIPSDCEYYDGHFPEIAVLPAVAQFELVIRFAAKYLGTPIAVRRIKRIKFSDIIWPDSTVRLHLTYNAEAGLLTFKITRRDSDDVHAQGTITL
ncbi:MAG: hydroxymyristoyl-ACP dehydratase [Treponema sp.]|jgi:3-hydroxymyristoyl/3-hydroxydecanoyl-(acyl carrier protein) dehydratase|nr:hydroxymyristoyl-ACP dehydratase [Treponema sp.]